MNRSADVMSFYEQLDRLRDICGGYRTLASCHGRMAWPRRGVYFFFEPGEERRESGTGLRVVRVGTHAVSANSKTTLWKRLANHKGSVKTGGGSHRGSVFRLLVGYALAQRDGGFYTDAWLEKHVQSADIRQQEHALECAVSQYIGAMPFLWVMVDDDPSKASQRSFLERNAIGLLSNVSLSANEIIDAPSSTWLGQYCHKAEIRTSGLWNTDYVYGQYDPAFLDTLSQYITVMQSAR